MKNCRRLIAFFMAFIIFYSGGMTSFAIEKYNLGEVVDDTAAYMYKTVSKPEVGSIGGEWAVLGLARSSYKVPNSYYDNYYATVEKYVSDLKGKLHDVKYTEYSRVILALTATGYDPRNVAGYNLIDPLADFDKTIWQGINGPIFALIALDSGGYEITKNSNFKVQATRDMYVDEILRRQLTDGGFSLFGGTKSSSQVDTVSDPDITAMALQALSKYQHRDDVKKVINEALTVLSLLQNDSGGYSSWGTENVESVSQVVVALTELGIPLDDPRFIKNGHSLLDNLMSFYKKGNGFLHTTDGSGVNQMATEQAFYALVAVQRAINSKESLYNMIDVSKKNKPINLPEETSVGLIGKNSDIKVNSILYPNKTFDDIKYHTSKSKIEVLAERGIISGKTETVFEPDATMTRAEFASIIVRALGVSGNKIQKFIDVSDEKWYAKAVGTAYSYGIISGESANVFNPNDSITREQAAVMITKAAKLTGLDTEVDEATLRDTLAQFSDYTASSSWARQALAFCYKENILKQEDINIRSKEPVKRYEVSEMVYNLLKVSNLL
ncbi:S-layer homology domain-containing protein [Acetoanaerobium noterae]|uniref:S-layer homology domain-containing protein n=1 Tax=Acetoanaerobium noterae TaxID=745369 RepID=UPI003330D199